jgi:hypothetical protein
MNLRDPLLIATLALVSVLGVSTAIAAGTHRSFAIHSTLDGKRVLPQRIRWIAKPHISSANVAAVKFLIDGRWLWTEHEAPYFYGGNDGRYGNWLITSFLKPGLHTFTIHVVTFGGRSAIHSVRARVIQAPPPPTELAGTWKHVVDGNTTTDSITTLGWGSPRDKFDARYLSGGRIVFGPLVVFPQMSPSARLGGFCNGIDPLHTWTYSVASDDKSFELHPVGTDPCPDRQHGLEGSWTRVG